MAPNKLYLHRWIYGYGYPNARGIHCKTRTHTTTHIEIKSQPEKHTIKSAELAAITMALEANKYVHNLSILDDSAFVIYTIRKYAIDPLDFLHHPHKNLLQLADEIIHTRDNMWLKTNIGKVKPHTEVTHNDEVDTTARNVVEGHTQPDIIYH
jgi:ribonuclease HI